MTKQSVLASALCGALVVGGSAEAGLIVVANDEWTLSDAGFSGPNDPGTFATNVAAWFTGGGPGTFHAYSTNFGLTESSLATAMTGAGHTWTTGTGITFDLPTLLTFDGIFLAGSSGSGAANNAVLIAYVSAGGNVYLAGGTGTDFSGSAAAEAAAWNTFLNAFGLEFASTYNGSTTNLAVSSPHPIFVGVDSLFQSNGNSIVDLAPLDPQNQILVGLSPDGLYAVFDPQVAPVPEPSTISLGILGLLGLAARYRRRH